MRDIFLVLCVLYYCFDDVLFLMVFLHFSDLIILKYYIFVFFFQAEDGIRDIGVTGVQTCALPISAGWSTRATSPPTPTPTSAASTCPPPRWSRRTAGSPTRAGPSTVSTGRWARA